MTTTIYVTSTHHFSGKSAICVGLLQQLKKDGFKIGFMKPVSTTAHLVGDRLVDEDVKFIKSIFDLDESLEDMTPVMLTDRKVSSILSGEDADLSGQVRSAFETISNGKDVVVLEGGGSLREGWIVNLAPPHVSNLLQARELVVVPFIDDLQLVDDLITARVRLGDSLLGGVVNSAPKHRTEFVHKQVTPFAESRGVGIYAVMPKEKILLSVSVSEINEGLGGQVLCAHDAVDALVSHLVVGAMGAESALRYFRQKPNKAVITGGDRPDIQMAALETSTRCLILTGNIRPGPQILGRAEEQGVPIILTHFDTMTTIDRIERFFGKTRFHQSEKVQHFQRMFRERMDFDALYRALGL
jgi:BioD-like phosphotransacetylase family protein